MNHINQTHAEPPGATPPAHLLLCVNDTPGNARWECTARCLTSIGITADLQRHPLWIVDNGSTCPVSRRFVDVWCRDQIGRGTALRLFRLPHNRHATYAFNRLLHLLPGDEFAVRIENDIEFHTVGWPELLVRGLIDGGFGLLSPKPQDLPEKALGVPVTEAGGMLVHEVDEVPGYCTAILPTLRHQLGALVSAGNYIEDVLTSRRALRLGYRMAFLAPSELRCFHVDRLASPDYQAWKLARVAVERPVMTEALRAWDLGLRPTYVPFELDDTDGFHEVAW